MSNYYMIITNQIDYEWDIENKFQCAGLPERNRKTVQNLEIGDKIIYYVTKVSSFVAVVEVVGRYYYSLEQIWDDPYDLWPHRVHTKPLLFIDDVEKGVYIKDIWDDLDFIVNKQKWGSQVQGSFKRLSKNDFKVIYEKIKKKV